MERMDAFVVLMALELDWDPAGLPCLGLVNARKPFAKITSNTPEKNSKRRTPRERRLLQERAAVGAKHGGASRGLAFHAGGEQPAALLPTGGLPSRMSADHGFAEGCAKKAGDLPQGARASYGAQDLTQEQRRWVEDFMAAETDVYRHALAVARRMEAKHHGHSQALAARTARCQGGAREGAPRITKMAASPGHRRPMSDTPDGPSCVPFVNTARSA